MSDPSENEMPAVHGEGSFRGSGAVASGIARTRTNFGVSHLLSAATFSRRLAELEAENAGKKLGPFWQDVLANATAAVFTCVAGLESYVNELYADHAIVFPEVRAQLMAKIWGLYEQKPLLDKYELALLIKQVEPLDAGAPPYQDVAILIKLRNALVHFKPEWFDEQKAHATLSKNLQGKIQLSPLFDPAEPLFPRGWASHSCARWAVDSVTAFILEFERRAGLPSKLAKFTDRLRVV